MTRDANGRFASAGNGGEGAVSNGATDPLGEYKEALAGLVRAKEKLGTLRGLDTELHGTVARLQDERERCLTSESDDSVEELSRLNARLEITQRRISGKALEIEQAG